MLVVLVWFCLMCNLERFPKLGHKYLWFANDITLTFNFTGSNNPQNFPGGKPPNTIYQQLNLIHVLKFAHEEGPHILNCPGPHKFSRQACMHKGQGKKKLWNTGGSQKIAVILVSGKSTVQVTLVPIPWEAAASIPQLLNFLPLTYHHIQFLAATCFS